MRLAGMEVQVRTTGRPEGPLEDPPDDPLPPAVDLAAYRVVQEALTNVLRHGGEKVATVEVAHETGAVSVTVSNPGSFSDGTHRSAGGLGLAGMRERVEALGGRFSAGAIRGGFEVRAWLPVRQAP
jgi:signal transduction histidine kinase